MNLEEKENANLNKMEKNNIDNMEKNNTNNMDEKVHYEIKFTETEDGYFLEATGDKKTLRRLGIGPNMVGRRQRSGRAQRARELRKINRQRRRLAAKARRLERMDHPWAPAGIDRPGRRGPDFGPREHMPRGGEHGRHPGHRGPGFEPRRRFQGGGEHGRHPGQGWPRFEERNHKETWNW